MQYSTFTDHIGNTIVDFFYYALIQKNETIKYLKNLEIILFRQKLDKQTLRFSAENNMRKKLKFILRNNLIFITLIAVARYKIISRHEKQKIFNFYIRLFLPRQKYLVGGFLWMLVIGYLVFSGRWLRGERGQ